MTRVLGDQVGVYGPEGLDVGDYVFVRGPGWIKVDAISAGEWSDGVPPSDPVILTLAEPYVDDNGVTVTELEYPPYNGWVLASRPPVVIEEGPDNPFNPIPDDPPTEPTGHYVYHDAGTGEFVSREYAEANPETTYSEWIPDEPEG